MALIARGNVPESCLPFHAISVIDRPNAAQNREPWLTVATITHNQPTSHHLKKIIRGPFALKLLLQTFLAGLAHFDALAPLRVQYLVCADASAGVGIQYRVDDISASRLMFLISSGSLSRVYT